MKNIINSIKHKDDDRDIKEVWTSFINHLKEIRRLNEKFDVLFSEKCEEVKILDKLLIKLEEDEGITSQNSEAYKNVKFQIQLLRENYHEMESNRNLKIKIEGQYEKDVAFLSSYFEKINKIDMRYLLHLDPKDLLVLAIILCNMK
jgi:hypothetical protein